MNRDTIVRSLRNPAAVERAIVLLYRGQTADEQSSRTTRASNGRGFNSKHAPTGSYYAKWILSGNKLTGGYLAHARKICEHYAGGQLLAAAQAKALSGFIARETQAAAEHANAIAFHDPFQHQLAVGVGFLAGDDIPPHRRPNVRR